MRTPYYDKKRWAVSINSAIYPRIRVNQQYADCFRHARDGEATVLAQHLQEARWLVRNDQDAEDIVQESFFKAFKAQESFRGSEAKTWMLAIVRNTAMDFRRRLKAGLAVPLGDAGHEPEDDSPDPESALVADSLDSLISRAMCSELSVMV